MNPFEDYILLISSSPEGRVFFCREDIFCALDPCVNHFKIFHRRDNFILFQTPFPAEIKSLKEKACHFQTCRYCKGYGIVKPTAVYRKIYSLGLIPFRIIPDDWYYFFHDSKLFNTLIAIYNTKRFGKCFQCWMAKDCKLQSVRKECNPIPDPSVGFIWNPSYIPPATTGVFPFMAVDSFDIKKGFYCIYVTSRAQASGTFQQGMRNVSRFYFAKYVKSVPIVQVPLHIWDLCYQYFISRFFRQGFKIRPFIITSRIKEQITFGADHSKVKDYSDFLWRTRPLINVLIQIDSKRVKLSRTKNPLGWDLEFEAIQNFDDDLERKVNIGLRRLFGMGF